MKISISIQISIFFTCNFDSLFRRIRLLNKHFFLNSYYELRKKCFCSNRIIRKRESKLQVKKMEICIEIEIFIK